MTDTNLKEPLLAEGEEQAVATYRDTQIENTARIGEFKTPEDYLNNLALKTNLKELYDIIGIQVTNSWQSHTSPYVIVVEVKEEELQKLYGGKFLIQIWRKANESTGTLLYEKAVQSAPKDFSIRKELCIYQAEEEQASSINNDATTTVHNINIIDLDKQTELTFKNPFGQSEGCAVYIDVDNIVIGFEKKIYIYDTKAVLNDGNYNRKEITLNCDTIQDINFSAVGKSYVLVSTILNQGKTVQYFYMKVDAEKTQKGATFDEKNFHFEILGEFNCEIPDDKYIQCIVQPYDYFVLLTEKGNFEVYKHEGERKQKLQFSSHKFFEPSASITKVDKVKEKKAKVIRELLDEGVVEIKIVYNSLVIKTKQQKKTYYVSVAKLVDFSPATSKDEFDETILQLALFNPVFFNNNMICNEDILLSHDRFVSIKNIPTGQWQHLALQQVDSAFRKKDNVLQELSLYRGSDTITLVVSKKDKLGWILEKKNDTWSQDIIQLCDPESADCDIINNIYQLHTNYSIIYVDIKNPVLVNRYISKIDLKKRKVGVVKWLQHLVTDVNQELKLIPLRMTGAVTIFILWNITTKKATIHREEVKSKNGLEGPNLAPPLCTLSSNACESISACNYKKDTILILMNGMFYEFNIAEQKLITHTKPARGGIEKPPIETEELEIIGERWLYFVDDIDKWLYVADLTQFKQGGISIRDFIKIDVCYTYHNNISFDFENERILLMMNRFQVEILSFLHSPRVIFYKTLNNPEYFYLSQHHKDKIYGFEIGDESTSLLTCWSAINTHLVSFDDITETLNLKDWNYLCQAGNRAVFIKNVIQEEGAIAIKHDDMTHSYQVVSMDFSSGACKVIIELSYTHNHKKFANIRYSTDCTRMLEQNGKSDTCTIYQRKSDGNWDKIRELQDIKDLYQVSPCMKYFYSPKTFKFLEVDVKGAVTDQEEQQELFKMPDSIQRNLIEVIMKEGDCFIAILKNGIAKEFKITPDLTSFNDKRCFVHNFDDLSVTRQYHFRKIAFLQQKDDLVQTFARLNDFYRFQTKFNNVYCTSAETDEEDNKFTSIFSVSDSFVDNKASVNFPFTFYHWSLMEKIAAQEFRIGLLQKNIVQELMFMINPQGESLFYKLANQFKALRYVYDTINDEFTGIEKVNKCQDMMPYIQALNGRKPLDLAAETRDTKSCDQLLLILKKSEFDNHQDDFKDFFETAFEFNLLNIGDYFDCRLFPSDQLGLKIERGGLEVPEYGFALSTVPIGENDIEKIVGETCLPDNIEVPMLMKILDIPGVHRYDQEWSKKLLKCLSSTPRVEIFGNKSLRAIIEFKWPIIKNALLRWLFVPYVFLLLIFLAYSVYILQYYQAVNGKDDLDGLMNKKDISDQYQLVCQKGLFSDDDYIYQIGNQFNKTKEEMESMCNGYDAIKDDGMTGMKEFLKYTIMIFCAYFLFNEGRQMTNGLGNYFGNPWNYVDLLPIAFITGVMFLDYVIGNEVPNQKFMRSILSLAIFFLWMKFLYFLRLFRGTSYLISMIIEVTKDMQVFLLLFLVSTLAFGNCFYVFNENLGGDSFITNYFQSFTYAYEMVLGNFDTDKYTKGTTIDYLALYTLFVLATLFLMIIMLNLLIAIISDSYARVQQQSTNLMYKGMADLIFENDYLLSKCVLDEFHRTAGEYLVIVQSEEDGADTSSVEGKIQAMQNIMSLNHTNLYAYIRNMKKDMDETTDSASGFQQRLEAKMGKVEKDIQAISKMVKDNAA